MKKTLKMIFCGTMAGVMLLLAACGTTGGAKDPSGGEKASQSKVSSDASGSKGADGERTKISFWHMIPEGSTNYDTLETLILGFNDTQDQYEVEHVGYPFFDFFDKMTTAFAGDVAPDVFLYTMDNVPSRASTNITLDLTPYMQRDNYTLDDFYELEAASGVYEDKQFALPFSSTCRLLYYNLDIMESAGLSEADVPTTWAELDAISHKMDIVEDGVIQQLGFDPFSGHSNLYMYLWQKELDFFDSDNNPVLDTPEVAEVVQWMADFNKQYPSSQLQAFTDATKTLAADPFVSGKLGLMVSVDEEHKLLQNNNVPFRYGVAPLPLPENGKHVTWSSCFSIEAINSENDATMDGSWEFIKYMLTPESQSAFHDSQGWLSASRTATEKLIDDPIMATIIGELPYAVEKKYVDYLPNWHVDWDQFKERIIAGEDVNTVLVEAQKYYLEKQENSANRQ